MPVLLSLMLLLPPSPLLLPVAVTAAAVRGGGVAAAAAAAVAPAVAAVGGGGAAAAAVVAAVVVAAAAADAAAGAAAAAVAGPAFQKPRACAKEAPGGRPASRLASRMRAPMAERPVSAPFRPSGPRCTSRTSGASANATLRRRVPAAAALTAVVSPSAAIRCSSSSSNASRRPRFRLPPVAASPASPAAAVGTVVSPAVASPAVALPAAVSPAAATSFAPALVAARRPSGEDRKQHPHAHAAQPAEEPVFAPCHHTFCNKCIRERINSGDNSCPECRRPLKESELQPNAMAIERNAVGCSMRLDEPID